MENSGKLKTIDELDPVENRIDEDNLTKFLSEFDHTYMDRARPKGPDYLIIDNFVEIFGIDKADLIDAKSEAEEIKRIFWLA